LMVIIIDFDRPGDGFVIVDELSIEFVIADMEADLGQ
jgi:hypothetical protein